MFICNLNLVKSVYECLADAWIMFHSPPFFEKSWVIRHLGWTGNRSSAVSTISCCSEAIMRTVRPQA